MDNPSPIAAHRPKSLPEYADVVVVGSGITGTSFARTLLSLAAMKVVMLEAREACSGASGRNGGHINPPLHDDFGDLKRKYGMEEASKIIRFRLAHIDELTKVAEQEDILKESQSREVESIDVYYNSAMYGEAKERIHEWKTDLPQESREYHTMDGSRAMDKFRLASSVVGVVYNRAGAFHPYRFVTSILEKLLKEHDQFCLSTRTPCTAISPPTAHCPFYTVMTPTGAIITPHVVHATNAWTSHLLEPMRSKIVPVRNTMSAQRPGTTLSPSTLDGQRSWCFYEKNMGCDYLTQLPNGENELMFGGGGAELGEMGIANDDGYNIEIAAHLAGALPVHFGEDHWGAEGLNKEGNEGKWFDGRVKALWSGIAGISADGLPWVGRVPPRIAGRREPPANSCPSFSHGANAYLRKTAAPGEWIAGGYSGEGMTHAFMSGQALAYMLLGMEDEGKLSAWFPDTMRVTEERWKKAGIADVLGELQNL